MFIKPFRQGGLIASPSTIEGLKVGGAARSEGTDKLFGFPIHTSNAAPDDRVLVIDGEGRDLPRLGAILQRMIDDGILSAIINGDKEPVEEPSQPLVQDTSGEPIPGRTIHHIEVILDEAKLLDMDTQTARENVTGLVRGVLSKSEDAGCITVNQPDLDFVDEVIGEALIVFALHDNDEDGVYTFNASFERDDGSLLELRFTSN